MATPTSTVDADAVAAPAADRTAPQPADRPVVLLSEVAVGVATLAVALLAWAATALAHLGLYSLPLVAAVEVLALVALGIVLRRRPPRIRVDRLGLLVVAALGLLAAVLFLPGFSYGVTDKDPGGYTEHAFSIARTGDYRIQDPTLDGRLPGGPVLEGPGARFAALWLSQSGGDEIVPQFYHLWPSLLAVSHDVGGIRGMAQTAPLIGVLSVLTAALVVRRAVGAAAWTGRRRTDRLAGLVAGATAGVLLATNMLEVWQAKYPTTEVSAQLFFLASLLGLAIALDTGWRPAAGAAGLLTGIGFLDRADNLLVLLLAAGVGAALVAARRWDGRATWFACGLAVVLPHALWQAYSPAAGLAYSEDNGVPGPVPLVLAVAVLAVLAVVTRPVGGRVAAALSTRGGQLRAGVGLTALVAVLLVLGFLRPSLFGDDYQIRDGVAYRTYDEEILARLSWFVSAPVFALLFVGVAVVALRRWSAPLWVLVVPLLAIFPVYGLHARNSVRLMWWSRRFLPVVLPLVLMLAAVALTALAFLLAERVAARRARAVRAVSGVGAAAALVALVVMYLGQSLPLRTHSEFGGSFELSQRIASAAGGQQGVFLWQRSPACCLYAQSLFGGALWLERDQISALLPSGPDEVAPYLADFRRAFPGQPQFVVWHRQVPPQLPGVRLEPVDRVQTALSYWEEKTMERPDAPESVPVDFVIYRVAP